MDPLTWSSQTYLILITCLLLFHLFFPWPAHPLARFAREFCLLLPAGLCYFLVRGAVVARADEAMAHAETLVELERSLGIFIEPRLQTAILDHRLLVDLANWIYIWGHWPVILAWTVWLWSRHSQVYPIYRNAFLISGGIGLIIFALFPVAPPRFQVGWEFVDTVTLRSRSYRVLQPPALANPYAAMPSLHVGWDLLVGIGLLRHARHRHWRTFGMALPLAMTLAVILTANHYVLDVVAGVSLALFGFACAIALRRWRERRVARTEIAPAAGSDPATLQMALLDEPLTIRPVRTGQPQPERPGREGRDVSGCRAASGWPLAIAHRMGNSLAGLRQAEAIGVDLVEADVWLHRGRLEVRHLKTLGPLPLLWDRWALTTAWAPRLLLADLLRAARPETGFMLDLKGRDPRLPERLVETIDEHGAGRLFFVCSQNWDLIEAITPRPGVTIVYSASKPRQLRRLATRLARRGPHPISVHARLLDAATTRALKEQASAVFAWDVVSADQMAQLLDWGVDGIITRDPDLLRRLAATPRDDARAPGESPSPTVAESEGEG